MSSSVEAHVVHDFLVRRLDDRDRGEDPGLEAYQRLYPGYERAIEREYAASSAALESEAESFGPYRVERELGRGGQGVVYLARDVRLDRRVAIKALSAAPAAHAARLRREMAAIAKLDHPGICRVLDAGERDGHPWFAMRYVEGVPLATHVRDGAPPTGDPQAVAALVERVARALHHAHEAEIVHRDVKPANIVVEPSGEPVVLDFGLARGGDELGGALTVTGEVFGSPPYMAPEQVDPRGATVDRRSDVYSLGVTLYECLTGRRPFESATLDGLYHRILEGGATIPRDLPRDLATVLRTAIEREPARRYRTAAAFADDLRCFVERRPIRARPTGPLLRSWLWARRRPALAGALAAAALSLIGGLAVSLHLLGEARSALDESLRQADARMLPYLERVSHEELWPEVPEKIEAMDRWLADARALRGRLEADPGRLIEPEDLQRLRVAVEEVEARRAFAGAVVRRTIDEHAGAWAAAIDAVAADPRFAGFTLAPIVGLIPLGADPTTGLQELAHLRTGEPPARIGGELALGEEHGLVFVLVPGGAFGMGAERPSPTRPAGSPNADPDARPIEGPVHRVELGPFLISKYEMTQAQWLRAGVGNPSRFVPEPGSGRGPANLLHPVETVSWSDCVDLLPRLGLTMPTEAQWEYAARAGTTTPWWTGADERDLAGATNLADRAILIDDQSFPHDSVEDFLEDDGWSEHAPIGSFDPNGFGLHDVIGNVMEWCLDPQGSYESPVRAGDGYRGGASGRLVVARGGSFESTTTMARSAMRDGWSPKATYGALGVRPAIPVPVDEGP